MSKFRAYLREKYLRIVGAIVLVVVGVLCILDSERVADLRSG